MSEREKVRNDEFHPHRVAIFDRTELIKILTHYTLELMEQEQPALDKETADRYELGRRAIGHLPSRKAVSKIERIEVYQTGLGVDDIRVRTFLEADSNFSQTSAEPDGNVNVLQQ
jgi:hypothetical protein